MSQLLELGYAGFSVSDLAAWDGFAADILGLCVVPGPVPDSRWLRMDERHRRIILTQGDADDIAFLGWRVADEPALAAFAAHLARLGIGSRRGNDAEHRLRGAAALLHFNDPDGNRHEAYIEEDRTELPFFSPVASSGFVTGDGGLGHAVLGTHDYPAMVRFAQQALGFSLSDIIRQEVAGAMMDISFLHMNERHHSLALSDRMGPKRLHHLMLEVGRIEDVGKAQDRHRVSGWPIIQNLGQHPNDRMISYYGATPSGFLVEYGWGGVKIDDEAAWQVVTYPNISDWGHHREVAR